MSARARRRTVLGSGIAAVLAPQFLVSAAGEPTKTQRVGMPVLQPRSAPPYRAFEERLRELGYEDGHNLQLDFVQITVGDADAYGAVIKEMIAGGANLILAGGPEIALKSAVAASKTVPIVMVAIDYDPLARGYVGSLARPDGNVSGVFLQQIELTAKRLELLTVAFNKLKRVIAVWDQISADQFEAAREAARSLRLILESRRCADPPYDYAAILAGVDGRQDDVLLQMTSPFFFRDRELIAAAALAHHLPSMFSFREWVDAGGLLSYGASVTTMYRMAADYVVRILHGAKPADLPIEQPTKFELVINLKTAKALGLTVPQSLLARADEVIE